VSVGNHEFLSPDKEGFVEHDTQYNSWTDIDGCNWIKEGYKEGKTQIVTQDHSGEFLSLSVADFMAEREPDGSLPNNNFARLKSGSIFKDMGTPIIGFTPTRWMTAEEATSHGLELITADDIYIPFNDAAPDFGAFELDGVPFDYVIPEKIELTCLTANSSQEVVMGADIEDIMYEWSAAGTDAVVENLAEGLTWTKEGNTLTISGKPQTSCTFRITVSGNQAEGVKPVSTTGIISIVRPYEVITGDWYHFLDAEDDMPADLKSIFELIQGDKSATTIDPEKEESSSGFGKGALCLGESNGGFKLTLEKGVLELKINLFFTGGRQFKITYTMADGSTQSVTTEKYKKGSYGEYDILGAAGLTSEDDRVNVRSITFQQNGANGGARIYDLYVKIPAAAETPANIHDVSAASRQGAARKYVSGGRLVIMKNGARYNAIGQTIIL
jgi:hypothetical protein